jgi:hypothetical protein
MTFTELIYVLDQGGGCSAAFCETFHFAASTKIAHTTMWMRHEAKMPVSATQNAALLLGRLIAPIKFKGKAAGERLLPEGR